MTLTIAVTAGAIMGASIGGAAWWMAERYRTERDSPRTLHAGRLRPILKEMLDVGNKIEYDIRGDKNASARLVLYATRIEDWRTDVSHFVIAKLPNSGADVKFLTFRPRVGQGGLGVRVRAIERHADESRLHRRESRILLWAQQ